MTKYQIWKRSKSIYVERLKKICQGGKSKKWNTMTWLKVKLKIKKRPEREKFRNSRTFTITKSTVISTRFGSYRGTLKTKIKSSMA